MLLTDQAFSIISTYAADVSGVCSALFEFGGMCVMHDASGCNSTYNTHDEPRWYSSDSMVYISGLSEMEAVMGDDSKITDDIVNAANELKPRFVAIAGTTIPAVIGTDLEAIAYEVQNRTGIPAFSIPSDGMHSYLYGAGIAFKELVCRFAEETARTKKLSVNILGTTPLDFSVNGYTEDLNEYLKINGIEVIAQLGMGGNLDDVKRSASAHVNLVVSSCGIPVAKWMKEKFDIPYVMGIPIKGSMRIADLIKDANRGSQIFAGFAMGANTDDADTYIIHEPVYALSLREYLQKQYGICANVISPPDADGFFKNSVYTMDSENKTRELLKNAVRIIADPMYKPICPKKAEFIPLAHEAFSGRIYRNDIPNLLDINKYV